MEKKTKEEMKGKHWTEIIVDQLLGQKKPPFVITGGMTTSGPAHLGTVCEFMYPAVLEQSLRKAGHQTQFHFVGDIMDAFDGIPFELLEYKEILTPELGKPLVYTIDPKGCHKSFGEHYLNQAKTLMKWLSFDIDVVNANDLYDSGKVDQYAMLFLREEDKVKEVVARTSMKKIEDMKDWSPIMPICEKCGKIATTLVTWHSEDEYRYTCNKDVEYTKGCNYTGNAKLKDHHYKLQWRLHWPVWQTIFDSSIEGSGMDHMTKGGSATTAYSIHKEILHREPPILFKYGFIMINGKKYSKSKGIGMSAIELSTLIPPEILKYMLIEPDLQSEKDIDPTGEKLIRVYDTVERISKLEKTDNRADEKKMLAFKVAIGKLQWKASFVDILLNYQISKSWDQVGKMLKDPEGVSYLAPYIERWLAKGYAPERYNFAVKQSKISENHEVVKDFISKLKPEMGDLEVHNLVYTVAESNNVKVDAFFASIYTALIGKDKGPRLGKLITSIGIEKTKEMLSFAIS